VLLEVQTVDVVVDGDVAELGGDEVSDKVEVVGELEREMAELGVLAVGGDMEDVGEAATGANAKSR